MDKYIDIDTERTCSCTKSKISCMSPKEWMQSQVGVWTFNYEDRDVRNKNLHPATFPISMATKVIKLLTHEGELVLDPFCGSGTTLVAANDLDRNAVGFDLKKEYTYLSQRRLAQIKLGQSAQQIVVNDDARNIDQYVKRNSVKLIFTSPPYANLLNRPRTNKSRRYRDNEQLGKVEQYSQDSRDLGTLEYLDFERAIFEIFFKLRPLMKYKAHCVINISDIWMDNTRIPLHINIVKAMERAGYELRNTIIWDRRNIVNNMGIFGYPSNYITMGTTFEYILDFWNPTDWHFEE